MKLSKKDARRFSRRGVEGWAYSTDSFPMSCAHISVNGIHGRIKNKKSNRLYFVISGSGEFDANGRKLKVGAGDVVLIAKNTPYNYKGRMKLLLVDSPAFNPNDDVELE